MEKNYQSLSSLFKVTEVELIYHNKVSDAERRPIHSSSAAYDVLIATWDMNKIELVEQFKIILLDSSGKCLGLSEIATGGIASCIADPRIIFSTALKARACSIILSHNHPSGNLKPSNADVVATNQLIEAGRVLGITVQDHLIVTRNGYKSVTQSNHFTLPF